MFAPPSNLVVAPVTTPVFSTPAANGDITAYCSDFKATDPNTIATVGSIISVLADESLLATPLGVNCAKLFRPGVAAEIIELCVAPDAADIDDNAANIRAILANKPSVPNWMINLISAAKKKPLEDGNVEGFFAMLGHTGTKASAVARLINQITPFFPDSIGDDAFRALLAPGIWTTYRNTRVSSGGIILKLLPDFRNLGITAIGDANETFITASANAPWDAVISLLILDKFKAYACIFLTAAGTPIDNWYQGNKARDDMPAARVRGATAIFKKYLEVKNNTQAIDGITTVAGFNVPAVTGFF